MNRSVSWGAILGITAVVVVVAVLVFFIFFFATVPSGHVGVIIDKGKVNMEEILPENWYVKPLTRGIQAMSIRNQEVTLAGEGTLKGDIRVDIIIKVVYRLDAKMAAHVFEYATSDYRSTLMSDSDILDTVKAAIAPYEREQVAQKRDELMVRAREALNAKVNPKGLIVESVSLENFSLKPEVEAALVRLAQAQVDQEAQAVQNQRDLDRAETERLMAVKAAEGQAEAEATKVRKAAEAEAEAIELKAEAQAEANKKLAESLTPALLQSLWTQQWSGKYPETLLMPADGSSTPFMFNLPSQTEQANNPEQ